MNNTMPENKKATAPIPAVAAAGEQSTINETTNIIPEKAGERNLRKGSLDTLSMSALYDTAYPPKSVIIENLLYAGTYLFAGAPKIGKSFFMAQLSYHIATGTPLWSYAVHPGEVLYLALEDDYARIQKRLFKMFGMQQLFEWLQNTQAHPFISSSAFHYEFLSRTATEEPVVVASTGPLFYLIPVVYDRRLFYRDGSRSSHICRLSQ